MLKLFHIQLRLLSVAGCCIVTGCETPQNTSVDPSPLVVVIPPDEKPDRERELTIVIESLQQQLRVSRQRLFQSYSDYWPLISSDHQHEHLPDVLGDPIPELRAFGIERVAVLLRDGEATVEELQLVVDRLRDIDPTVRLAAARLLPEINVPGIAEYVANSIQTEVDEQVATLELAFFQARPHPVAVDPVIDRLEVGPVGTAAKTLIVLLNSNGVSEDREQYIVNIVQQKRRDNDMPALVTLEAMLGNKRIQRNLIHFLDGPNASMRIAVAEGFASAGFAEPLIARADDQTLYAIALTALQKHSNIEAFNKLMNLYQENEPSWNAAVFVIASSLDTSSLLRADDLLHRIGVNELRLSVLTSIWEESTSRSLAARKAIARRAVPLMIESGDAVGALQLLDAFGESLIDDDLLSLRFAAAIAASAWDAAADVRSEPTVWIAAWNATKESDPAAASVIRQQIIQRFKDQLSDSQKLSLGIEELETTDNETP